MSDAANGEASRTAELAALTRYGYSFRPHQRRIVHDAYAGQFVKPPLRYLVRMPPVRSLVIRYFENTLPGGLGEVVVHTRYIDDYLKACLSAGIEQVIILGAGYDTRPYRIPELQERSKVSEVDQLSTLQVKTQTIQKVFGMLPKHVAYVSIDFQHNGLGAKLAASGYRHDAPTLFIWEAVTRYLAAPDVEAVLAFSASNTGRGTLIIVDHL